MDNIHFLCGLNRLLHSNRWGWEVNCIRNTSLNCLPLIFAWFPCLCLNVMYIVCLDFDFFLLILYIELPFEDTLNNFIFIVIPDSGLNRNTLFTSYESKKKENEKRKTDYFFEHTYIELIVCWAISSLKFDHEFYLRTEKSFNVR